MTHVLKRTYPSLLLPPNKANEERKQAWNRTFRSMGSLEIIPLAGAMVLFMKPGMHSVVEVAFLYGGLARRKSSLSLVLAVSASNAVAVLDSWGYSLAFSGTATKFWLRRGLVKFLSATRSCGSVSRLSSDPRAAVCLL